MFVRIVTVHVKPDRSAAFEAATAKNHRGSIAEPGVLRFDVLRDARNPGTYYLYEAYRDEAATAAHKETAHYAEWKHAVASMMVGDRSSVACEVVEPKDPGTW